MALISLINISSPLPVSFGRKIQICYNKTITDGKTYRIFRAYNQGKRAVSLKFYGIRIHGSKGAFNTMSEKDENEPKDYEYLPFGAVTKGYEIRDGDIILLLKLKRNVDGKYPCPPIDVAFMEPNGKIYIQRIKL